MTYVYFDASALAKRYLRERGTPEINHVFTRVPRDRLVLLAVAAGEVVSVLVRRRDGGSLTPAAYAQALSDFRAEVLDDPAVAMTEAGRDEVRPSLPLLDRHALNATDALVLTTALERDAGLRPAGHGVLLVTSDRRLAAAATAEGLPAFDPERQPAAAFDAAFVP